MSLMQDAFKVKIGKQDHYRQTAPPSQVEDVEMVSADRIVEADRHMEEDLVGCLVKLKKLRLDLLSGIVSSVG